MFGKLFQQVSITLIFLALTANTLKADMMFYYSAAILPSIVANKTPERPIKPMVSFKDEAHGYEPWIVDIENNEARMVKDMHTGSGDTIIKNLFVTISGITYFFADDGLNGYGLWKTDGSEEGTILVKNYHNTMTPYQIFDFKGKVHFIVYSKESGNQLWASDGTSEGSICITADANIGVSSATVVGDTIYLDAGKIDKRGQYFNNQLWKTDGTTAGIKKITDFEGYGADNLVNVNGRLYFRFFTRNPKRKHLYTTDGTAEGTISFPNTSLGYRVPLIPFKDKLFVHTKKTSAALIHTH